MGTLTIRLPTQLDARIAALARRRGTSKRALAVEAIERAVEEAERAKKFSAFELVHDLVGIGNGPSDLSTNPKHMRGYGK